MNARGFLCRATVLALASALLGCGSSGGAGGQGGQGGQGGLGATGGQGGAAGAGGDPGPPPAPFYVLDLRSKYVNCFGDCVANVESKGLTAAAEGLDEVVFAASVQGIVNRAGARLYLLTHEADVFWLDRATEAEPWGWAAGRPRVELSSATDLLDLFATELTGSVRWTADLPATLNVATTAAGIDGLAIVREGSALEAAVTEALPIAPDRDFVGKFAGKLDAMAWARSTFLDASGPAPATNPTLLAYILDGTPWRDLLGPAPTSDIHVPSVASRDYLVAEKGYVFDLSPWGDEAPVDDPTQPMGADLAEMAATLDVARARAAGSKPVGIWGFFQDKYTAGKHPNNVLGEFETSKLASQHGARLTGGGGQMFGAELANASFHRWGTFPRHAPRQRTPTPGELADLGYVNQWLTNPGFERGSLAGWTIDSTNKAIYADGSAPGGGRYLLQFNGTVGQNLFQDALVPPQAGETWRLRVQYRLPEPAAKATLVLWATGGPANEAAQVPLDLADGQWHEAEASLTVANAGHTALRAQVYLDAAGANVDLDEFRLARAVPWSSEVAPLTFVSFFMADYDLGTPVYAIPVGIYPTAWLQPERGTLPLGWNFAPDTVEYLPGVMHYYWATATERDLFTAPDSGAGYVNPSYLPQADRDVYVRYSRAAMGRMGQSAMSLFLNGTAGFPGLDVMAQWSALGADGVSANALPAPGQYLLPNGTPWLEIDGNSWAYAGVSLEGAIGSLNGGYVARYGAGASGPRFLTGRNVYVGVDFVADVLEGARQSHPERDYSPVDPYTLGYLFRQARGGANTHRASWVADTLARTALPGEVLSGTVTVRNDGWDLWLPNACELGVVLTGDGTTPSLAAEGAVVFAPLPAAAGPGEEVVVPVQGLAAPGAGAASLSYDVRCGGTWFEERLQIPYLDTVAVSP
jgi:hypothetical protein